jgi:hypothetical protein
MLFARNLNKYEELTSIAKIYKPKIFITLNKAKKPKDARIKPAMEGNKFNKILAIKKLNKNTGKESPAIPPSSKSNIK